MKSRLDSFLFMSLWVRACMALSTVGVAWSAPAISLIEVGPQPFMKGAPFTINVSASPDVTQGTATVDFRPAASVLLRITLAKQGSVWTGGGTIPNTVPDGAQATVKTLMFDAARARAEATVQVPVAANNAEITAVFSLGVLTVTGTVSDNTIVVSRDAAGRILVNGGAVPISGGQATVANTATIQVFGLPGNDTISLNEANGALPSAVLFGGAGNDTLIGGSGSDQLFGESGNDILLGKGGVDFLFGGPDNDTLTGGDADDQVFGESGNDRMIWNPGDDTDLNEGGDGTDTVVVNGGNGSEAFTTTANGTRVRFDRVTPAPFSIDIGTSENLVLNSRHTAGSEASALAALHSSWRDATIGSDGIPNSGASIWSEF